MIKNKLHIIGAGGHALMALDIAIESGFDEICVYDDFVNKINFYRDIKVEGTIEKFIQNCNPNTKVFIGIGDNNARSGLYKKLKDKSCLFPILKHKSAVVNKHTYIGEGSIIMPSATINHNAKIGNCGIINTNSTIDHDAEIGDFVHISPGVNIAGNVIIRECSWIGIGANVINNICIGKNAIIGAGSVVIDDIKDNIIAVGLPAKEINKDA